MESKKCNETGCELEIKYVCSCTSPETYLCKEHFKKHKKLSNRIHTFEYVFFKPHEGTKEAIIRFIVKEKCRAEKLKQKFISSFSHNLCNSENSFEVLLSKLESDLGEINNVLSKISQIQKISKLEQDPILKLLTLEPEEAIEEIKSLIPANQDSYSDAKLFCGLSKEIEKMIEFFIKDKFETIINAKLFKIEKCLEEHDRVVNLTNEKLDKIEGSVSKLIKDAEKSKREFEDWKQETKLERENEINLLSAQLNSITQELSHKALNLSETMQAQSLSEYKWSLVKELNAKTSEIFDRSNDQELEQDFRKTCTFYENELRDMWSSDPQFHKAYTDYINAYHLSTSLYIVDSVACRANLFTYDTESEREEVRVLETQEQLNRGTCIAQLPNGELFCYGQHPASGISLIIDRNYEIRMLPVGTPCEFSSALYFNREVYCFGGRNNNTPLALSQKFDLDKSLWIKLNLMPQPDCWCYSVMFNGNILISGSDNKNILRYSIDSNNFAAISFDFGAYKRKILVNVGRLYLIEYSGYIYESAIGDEYSWKQIAICPINSNWPNQVYCSYNKGAIYIGINLKIRYYKLDLAQKTMIRL